MTDEKVQRPKVYSHTEQEWIDYADHLETELLDARRALEMACAMNPITLLERARQERLGR